MASSRIPDVFRGERIPYAFGQSRGRGEYRPDRERVYIMQSGVDLTTRPLLLERMERMEEKLGMVQEIFLKVSEHCARGRLVRTCCILLEQIMRVHTATCP